MKSEPAINWSWDQWLPQIIAIRGAIRPILFRVCLEKASNESVAIHLRMDRKYICVDIDICIIVMKNDKRCCVWLQNSLGARQSISWEVLGGFGFFRLESRATKANNLNARKRNLNSRKVRNKLLSR